MTTLNLGDLVDMCQIDVSGKAVSNFPKQIDGFPFETLTTKPWKLGLDTDSIQSKATYAPSELPESKLKPAQNVQASVGGRHATRQGEQYQSNVVSSFNGR